MRGTDDRGAARRGVRIDVFGGTLLGLVPSVRDAEEVAFLVFVATLREAYAHLWPARKATGVRSTSRAWPNCWALHPGLVADLRRLQSWAAALAGGEVQGDAHAAWDAWRRYVETVLVDDLRTITSRICLHGHLNPAEAPAPPEPTIPEPPPLPGRPQPAAPSAAPAPTGPWAGFEGGSERAID